MAAVLCWKWERGRVGAHLAALAKAVQHLCAPLCLSGEQQGGVRSSPSSGKGKIGTGAVTIWRIGKGNVRFQLRIQSSLPPPAFGYRAGFFQGGIAPDADPEHLPPSAASPCHTTKHGRAAAAVWKEWECSWSRGFSQAEVILRGEFSNSCRVCRWTVQRKVCTEWEK